MGLILLISVGARPSRIHAVDIDPSCDASSSPVSHSGSALDTFTPTKNGVIYDGATVSLKLKKNAGVFGGTLLGISNKILSGCSADFNGDGWVDFVGIGTGTDGKLTWFKNQTGDNPAPDWTDPTKYRTPKFVAGPTIYTDTGIATVVTGCEDLNGDGKTDVVLTSCTTNAVCTPPSKALVFLGNGNGTFQSPYNFVTNLSSLASLAWSSNSLGFVDYNKDGRKDMVWGIPEVSGATGGKVIVLLNNGAASPKFDSQTPIVLVPNIGFGAKGPDAISVADFTGDGVSDYVVGGVGSANLRLYPGLLGGGVGSSQSIASGFTGGATAILHGNFSLSGREEIIVGTDGLNGYTGCKITYNKNSGTSTPFSAGSSWSNTCASTDLDMGWVFDYDHDPDTTPDMVVADGNNSGTYFLFANRVQVTYVDCGTVSSNVIDIGALSSAEMTVTDVRLAPTPTVTPSSDGTISWEASNDNGATWHPATACSDNANERCAGFGTTIGSKIRWRATLCSNTTGSAHTKTPTITAVATSYTYVTAQNHFRAGPVASDGVVYAGAFREPGEAGQFWALSDETGNTTWNGATWLDANPATARKVYTATAENTRVDFSVANKDDTDLQATLLVTNSSTTSDVVSWTLSKRFGLTTLHTLGAIENSTPAVLDPPKRPYWYTYTATTAAERTSIRAFETTYQNRQKLVFVGARDGALHAFFTNPANLTDIKNGREAWAFVPYDVAQRLLGDYTTGTPTAYPDGSPTLVNAKVGGAWKTVLLMGEGNGGRYVFALDVTDTVASDGTVLGPTPLWTFSDGNMGRTYSKPTVVRVKVNGAEQWLAIFASGPSLTQDVGDTLYAVDLTTGALVWRFDIGDSGSYISSDITASETDDETGTYLDGYIDRIFIADLKGRIWKIDPATFTDGVMTSVGSTVNVGLAHSALFSTKETTGGLGEERAISGTLTAATDSTNRLVLYFGTGGTEDTPAAAQNAFYAVYADTGVIRSKLDNTNGIAAGVKFYGGVVYNNGQLVFTNGQDLSGLGLCAPTAGQVVAVDANTFQQQFVQNTTSKIVAPVFAQNGEIYTVTLTGKLLTSEYRGTEGTTAPPSLISGGSSGSSTVQGGTVDLPFSILSWRQSD